MMESSCHSLQSLLPQTELKRRNLLQMGQTTASWAAAGGSAWPGWGLGAFKSSLQLPARRCKHDGTKLLLVLGHQGTM